MAPPTPPHASPYSGALAARVTAQIRAALAQGVRPWVQPWTDTGAPGPLALPQRANGQAYRGINIPILWAAAQAHGYKANSWYSYKQAQAAGAFVRKGERGTAIIFYSGARARADDRAEPTPEQAASVAPRRAVLRGYTVFNADQIEGLPPTPAQAPTPPDAPLTLARAALARVPADIRHGGDHAFYAPGPDFIQMPPHHAFSDDAKYCATLAHELAHWTRHPTRLNRSFGAGRFGSAAYALEELTAELAAAFIGAALNLAPDHIDDHASYIAIWLRVLEDQPAAFLVAAAKAQVAADYIAACWRNDAS
ncbi:MAG: ArdC family protein [Hyphomonadaceae bacterium]